MYSQDSLGWTEWSRYNSYEKERDMLTAMRKLTGPGGVSIYATYEYRIKPENEEE